MDIKEFSNKLLTHEINLKKVRALINFACACSNFTDFQAVHFLYNWVVQESLDNEGQFFLDHLLDKYKINYLDWCCLSKWVKRNIQSNINRKASFVELDEENSRFNNINWNSLIPIKNFVKMRQSEFLFNKPF